MSKNSQMVFVNSSVFDVNRSKTFYEAVGFRNNPQGGTFDPTPVQDLGFVYGRSLEDPNGHISETVWMNLEAVT